MSLRDVTKTKNEIKSEENERRSRNSLGKEIRGKNGAAKRARRAGREGEQLNNDRLGELAGRGLTKRFHARTIDLVTVNEKKLSGSPGNYFLSLSSPPRAEQLRQRPDRAPPGRYPCRICRG